MGAERLHHLDLLRASAMLLGIAYHGLLAFAALSLPLPRASALELHVAEWLTQTIHAFRLPLFFLLAGFFAALVVRRAGVPGFARARLRRIGLPLAVGVAVLAIAHPVLLAQISPVERPTPDVRPVHLWFLWYLLLLYATVVGARAVAPAWVRARIAAATGLLATRWALPLLIAGTTVVLVARPVFAIDPQHSFRPSAAVLGYYLAFFSVGWLAHGRRDVLAALGRGWRLQLAGAAVASVLLLGVGHATVGRPVSALTLACLTWWAVGGLLGAAATYASRPSPATRYVADASYWMFLVHLPIVLAVYAALDGTGLGLLTTVTLAVAITSAVSLATYAAFVRHTAIGDVLHGPRPLPEGRGAAVALPHWRPWASP